MNSYPTTALPADSLEQLNWMSGAWIEDTPLRRCEEIWSTVDAHTLMGMFRWISDDDLSFYEFMVIKVTDTGAELHVKHFHPTLVAWEEKDRFQAFVLTELDSHHAVFAAVPEPEESDVTGGWLIYDLTDESHLQVRLIETNEVVKLTFHFVREV